MRKMPGRKYIKLTAVVIQKEERREGGKERRKEEEEELFTLYTSVLFDFYKNNVFVYIWVLKNIQVCKKTKPEKVS